MTGASKRGGARGGFKQASGVKKKRPSYDDDDDTGSTARAPKKTKGDDDNTPIVPELDRDEEKNTFVALKANGTRRVTISEFKGKTMVSIREYYEDDGGNMRPGRKGITLPLDQYNALLAAAPLIESVLVEKGQTVVRPDYNVQPTAVAEGDGGEDEPVEGE